MGRNSILSRRRFVITALASGSCLTACSDSLGTGQGAKIDARVDATLAEMFRQYPSLRDLAGQASGLLVMPLVTEVGVIFGSSYGRGALRINNSTVEFYSAASGSGGLQFGAQQYSHVLFFMTDAALNDFRNSSGWVVGANAEYALFVDGASIQSDTTTSTSSVIAVVFGQAGLRVGATISGTKYSRLIF
ncbi:MAG: YSC84-related protein [Aestuariivita sp.]|nr:YSC84-related protein [Aestuariivita sp.]MCY4201071.1 YSC84-related protein [Aestuariivita sp.]MCY4288863.1 YSC84-related protein [Aestuariivita sp.]MCY4345217.1 YSC84-related protein [Aestuariivita sp.]